MTVDRVRAKVWCSKVTNHAHPAHKDYKTEELIPAQITAKEFFFSFVYADDPEHENKKFWDATPGGELSMYVSNPDGWIFEEGKEYYLDFTEAPADG